jgi:hypothetical protein
VSNSVVFALVVEFALMLLTVLVLFRPQGLFRSGVAKRKALATWSGFFFLLLTFIWSIVAGIVLAMNGIYLHF